jgi:hypothetical protein
MPFTDARHHRDATQTIHAYKCYDQTMEYINELGSQFTIWINAYRVGVVLYYNFNRNKNVALRLLDVLFLSR